jgi:hypothetical protein
MYNFVDCEPENIELFRKSGMLGRQKTAFSVLRVVLRKLCHLTASIMECKH